MRIPIKFRQKITRTFGEKGEKWLADLPQILSKCKQKWQLTNCRLSEALSYNFICFADALEYGQVVLKIGVLQEEVLSEIKTLSLYGGRHICTCYDYDMSLGAMLLERISPGGDLTGVKKQATRIRLAADLISKIPIPIKGDYGLPAYGDWVHKAFKRARIEKKVDEKMMTFINEAQKFYKEIEASDQPQVLLHGDLHHFNMLQDRNGKWKAIDPKGATGVAHMESARFMRNQLEMVRGEEKLVSLDEMTKAFGQCFDESQETMAKCLFVDTVLGACWSYEENAEHHKLQEIIDDCDLIYDYIMSLEGNM